MRALLQRVRQARVRVNDRVVGEIGAGLVIFLGVKGDDDEAVLRRMVERIVHLRIFADTDDKTNLSATNVHAEILAVSQFTLYADCRRGRRPGFSYAAKPEIAEPLYEKFVQELRRQGFRVATGIFAAQMLVEIFNDGPFTILLDSDDQGDGQ
jgi:D-aminoacyl-tRNA deacylase